MFLWLYTVVWSSNNQLGCILYSTAFLHSYSKAVILYINTTFRTVVSFVAKDNYKRCATNNDIYRCCHGGFPQFCELSAPVSINARLKRYCNMQGNEFCIYINFKALLSTTCGYYFVLSVIIISIYPKGFRVRSMLR